VNKRVLKALFAQDLPSVGPSPQDVGRILIDSRKVAKGDAFVALPGEKVDGHDLFRQP
jgi:UDP-N-acetylmuramyl pentapeptide synthase